MNSYYSVEILINDKYSEVYNSPSLEECYKYISTLDETAEGYILKIGEPKIIYLKSEING